MIHIISSSEFSKITAYKTREKVSKIINLSPQLLTLKQSWKRREAPEGKEESRKSRRY